MELIDVRKALGMTQVEFSEMFGKSQTWCVRFDHTSVDEMYDILSARQWDTLQSLLPKAEEIIEVMKEQACR